MDLGVQGGRVDDAILIALGLYTLLGSENEVRIGELVVPHGLRSLALGVSVSLDELRSALPSACCACPSWS